jgi:hypothetical protein
LRIRSQSDFWCGLIFVAIGLTFLIMARNYRMGSAARMGPGFFPTWLGGLLALLGVTLTVPSFVTAGDGFPRLHLRPMLALLASIAVFAFALTPLGFVIALMLLVVVAGFADPELGPVRALGVGALLTAFSVGIFHYLLGLPLPLWPSF